MKDDLADDLERTGEASVASMMFQLTLVVSLGAVEPPPPHTGWRSMERFLVASIFRGSAIYIGLEYPIVKTGLGYCAFHSHTVCAALTNREASRSGSGGPVFLGWSQRWRSAMVSPLE